MAVGVLVEMPGLTQVDFERVTEKLFGHYPMRPTDAHRKLLCGFCQNGARMNRRCWYSRPLYRLSNSTAKRIVAVLDWR